MILDPACAVETRPPDVWKEAMLDGDFEAAWQVTDRIELPRRERERRGEFGGNPETLLWDGSPFHERDVLVRCNHGLGDTLQFVRFLPRIQAVAKSVTVMVQPPLVRLLAPQPNFGCVLDGWSAPAPPHEVEIEIMELAYALRIGVPDLPGAIPYLFCDGPAGFGQDLPPMFEDGALRVGLIWAASDWDRARSLKLETLAPLGRISGTRFLSLQQGKASAERPASPFPLLPLGLWTREIANAAAAMLRLDLVITVDSMTAHLAGALGRPVWLLLQREADWRWMRGRNDSPWYPTMRIFRQPRTGDWEAVVRDVADALQELTGRGSAQ